MKPKGKEGKKERGKLGRKRERQKSCVRKLERSEREFESYIWRR